MYRIIKKFLIRIYNIKAKIILADLGKGSKIYWPGEVHNGKYMHIGHNCYIKKYAWLQAIKLTTDKDPCFSMGDGSYINRCCQIVITHNVTIGTNVTIADNVYIADTTHGYKDVNTPISSQALEYVGDVHIGDGTWLGRNVSVLGCSIGKQCVVGTGSFVTKDIPDYCVAVGSPARIIKRYNFATKQWEKTDKDGNFILKDN